VSQLFREGEFEAALAPADEAVQLSERLFGLCHPSTGSALNNSALMHRHAGRVHESLALYQRAREAYKQSVGEDSASYATCLHNLGIVHRTLSQSSEAVACLEAAIAIRQRRLDRTQALIADAKKAQQPLEELQQVQRSETSALASSLSNLGSVHRDRNDFPSAIRAQKAAVAQLQRSEGNNPEAQLQTATALNNIGFTYKLQGNFLRAFGFYEQALRRRLALHAPSHPDCIASYYNMAQLMTAMGNHDSAEKIQSHIVTVLKEAKAPQGTGSGGGGSAAESQLWSAVQAPRSHSAPAEGQAQRVSTSKETEQ
jgi:tetratricopeptide (TPR) repeat protein